MGILSKYKLKIKKMIGTVSDLKTETKIVHHWFGNDYGGFFLASDKLNSRSVVYSFGIGEDTSFDEALIKEFGCTVFGFDPTPKSIEWVKHKELPQNFHFFPYGINKESGIVEFLLPKNEDFVSGSVVKQKNVDSERKVKVPMKCLADITKDIGHSKIDVLKMDIEGSEYEVIESVLDSDVEVGQILIEIHERFFVDGVKKTKKMLESLNAKGYQLFAVSSSGEELSFIKA